MAAVDIMCTTVLSITFYGRSWCEYFSSERGIFSVQTHAHNNFHAECAWHSTKYTEIFVKWTMNEWINKRKYEIMSHKQIHCKAID